MLHTYECVDCGANPINHRAARWEVAWELFFDKLFAPLAPLRRSLDIAFAHLQPELLILPVVTILSWVGIAKKVREVRPEDTSRTRVLVEAAQKRRIDIYHVYLFGKPTSVFVARFAHRTIVYTHEPRPAGVPSKSLDWMDNKMVMVEKFQQANIPVPKTVACRTPQQALQAFRDVGQRATVKPILGSRSRHTGIDITTNQQLLHAFHVAKQISPVVIVEQQLDGFVYRATVIGGKVAGVLQREPAHVIGDGKSTVKELILEENKNPNRHGPLFHPLLMGLEAKTMLRKQELTFDSVPDKGRMVVLHPKVGRGDGGSNSEVTEQTNPENIALFEKIAAFLNDPLVGIDFIIGDIAKPWQEQINCGVIECNAMPFIDLHHYPLKGKPRDAAGALWDIVFPESKSQPHLGK